MKVILLKKVNKIGDKGQVKDVSPGYARNFLIPQNLAEKASPAKVNLVAKKMKKKDKLAAKIKAQAKNNLEKLKDKKIKIKAKSNSEGHLFAAIHKNDIIKEIASQLGVKLLEKNIKLDKPIKKTGEFNLTVQIKADKINIKLNIEAENDKK